MKIHQASFRTVQTDFNDDNKDTSAWVEILNGKGGEDENDGTQPKTGQGEISMTAKGKHQLDNVVSSVTEIESMVANQVARTTER